MTEQQDINSGKEPLEQTDDGNRKVDALVGLCAIQAWIDSKPPINSEYTALVIKVLLEDMKLADVRSITTYALGLERRKSNDKDETRRQTPPERNA